MDRTLTTQSYHPTATRRRPCSHSGPPLQGQGTWPSSSPAAQQAGHQQGLQAWPDHGPPCQTHSSPWPTHQREEGRGLLTPYLSCHSPAETTQGLPLRCAWACAPPPGWPPAPSAAHPLSLGAPEPQFSAECWALISTLTLRPPYPLVLNLASLPPRNPLSQKLASLFTSHFCVVCSLIPPQP